jgi:hypothetical protein
MTRTYSTIEVPAQAFDAVKAAIEKAYNGDRYLNDHYFGTSDTPGLIYMDGTALVRGAE